MSFADDSIGFYLDVQDRMTPKLKTAVRNYEQFTDRLEQMSKKVYDVASKGLGSIGKLVEELEAIPEKMAKAYDDGLKKLRGRMRVITQKVALEFSPKSAQNLSKVISKSVSDMLSKVSLRLSASIPLRRRPGFATGKSLRAFYREMPQPPDMKGMYQGIPRFAEGGEVTEGKGRGIDDVLALLSKGEIVIPADVADKLKELAQSAGEGVMIHADFKDFLDLVSHLILELNKLKKAEPAALFDELADSIDDAASAASGYGKSAGKLDRTLREGMKRTEKFEDAVDDLADSVDDLTAEVKLSDNAFMRFLQNTLSPQRILVMQHALEALSGATAKTRQQLETTFDAVAGGRAPVEGFLENLNESNVLLQMSRSELASFKADVLDASDTFRVSASQVGQGVSALAHAGARNRDFIVQNAELVAAISQATNISMDSAATAVFRYQTAWELTQDQVADFYATVRHVASGTAITSEVLASQMDANMESLGAFMERLDPAEKLRAMQGFTALTGAMADHWGEAGGQLTRLMADALAGSDEARAQLSKLNVDWRRLEDQARIGDFEATLSGLSDQLRSMVATGAGAERLRDILQFPGTAKELARTSFAGQEMLSTLRELNDTTPAVGAGMEELQQGVINTQSGFEGFQKSVGKWLVSKIPAGVLEFFEDFSLQAAFATAVLVKYSAEILIGIYRMLGFGKAAAVKSVAMTKTAAATAVMGKTAVATKGGTLIGGMFRVMAGGLQALANPKVLAGIAAIGLSVAAIVWATKDAKPLFEFLQTTAVHALDTFRGMFETLATLDATHALSIGASLLLLGPAFAALGTGIALFGQGALLGTPGIAAFGKVMQFLGADMGANVFMGSIEQLIGMFQTDPAKLELAVKNVGYIGVFLAGFTATMAAMGIARMVSFFQTANPINGLVTIFTGDDWNALVVRQAKDIRRVVEGVASTFGDLGSGFYTRMVAASMAMSSMAKFIVGFGKAVGALAVARFAAVLDKAVEGLLMAFTGTTSFVELSNQAGNIKRTVNLLIGSFGREPFDPQKMDTTANNITEMGFLLADFAALRRVFKDVQPGMLARIGEHYLEFYGIKSPMRAMSDDVDNIVETVKKVSNGFFLMGQDLSDARLKGAKEGISKSAVLMGAFTPLVEQSRELAKLSDDLHSGWLSRLFQQMGLKDGPLTKIRTVLMGVEGDDKQPGILSLLSDLGDYINTKFAGVGFRGVTAPGVREAAGHAQHLFTMLYNISGIAEQFVELESLTETASTSSFRADRSVEIMLANAARMMVRINAFDTPDLESVQLKSAAIADIATNMRAAIDAGLHEGGQVTATLSAALPDITRDDLERVVRVEIDNQQRPLLDAAQESNMLLAQILGVLSSQGTRSGAPPQRSAPRPISPEMQRLAEGGS